MRYMDLESHTKFMDVSGYKHNYEKTSYQMSINGENDYNSRCPYKPCGNSLISSLFLSW